MSGIPSGLLHFPVAVIQVSDELQQDHRVLKIIHTVSFVRKVI
jgi:hypothetical protein